MDTLKSIVCYLCALLDLDQTCFTVTVSCAEDINGVTFGYHWLSEQKPMAIFRADIQQLSKEAVWYFRPKPLHTHCPVWNFTVYIQQGKPAIDSVYNDVTGLPVDAKKTNLPVYIQQSTFKESVTLHVPNPALGEWYAVAMFSGNSPFALTLKELEWRWCFYQIGGGVYWNITQHNIPWIYPNTYKPVTYNLSNGKPLSLRIPPISSSMIHHFDVQLTNNIDSEMADDSIATVLGFRSNGLPGKNDVIMPSNITSDVMIWTILLLPSEIGVLTFSSSIDVQVTIEIKKCDVDCLSTKILTWDIGDTRSMSLLLSDHPTSLIQRIHTGQTLYQPDNNLIKAYHIPQAYTIILDSHMDSERVLTLELIPQNNAQNKRVAVTICLFEPGTSIQSATLPHTTGVNLCDGATYRTIIKDHIVKWQIPYPTPGRWTFVTYHNSTLHSPDIGVKLKMSSTDCYPECWNHGKCVHTPIAGRDYHHCKCHLGWQGINCEHEYDIDKHGIFLKALLLTLSNCFFLIPAILGIYKHCFPEAFVYFSTGIISGMYHYCDAMSATIGSACVLPFNILAITDFFCSNMCFWVTLLMVSEVTGSLKMTLYIIGILYLLIAVQINRTALWVFAGHLSFGLVIVITNWVVKSRKDKICFPGKKRVLKIIPGTILAGTALCLFSFVETPSNYAYVHSAWHAIISICVCFFFPPKRWQTKRNNRVPREQENIMYNEDAYDVFRESQDNVITNIPSLFPEKRSLQRIKQFVMTVISRICPGAPCVKSSPDLDDALYVTDIALERPIYNSDT